MTTTRGKYGVVELGFRLDSAGRTTLHHLHRRVPMVVQQALYFDEQLPDMATVYMLSSGGPVVQGDRYRVEVELGKGAMAHISTGAATIVASMEQGEEAELRQTIRLDEEAYLEWLPLPLIPSREASYKATTEIIIAPSASLLYGEVVACGRKHHNEYFDFRQLQLSQVVCHPSGRVVTRQSLRITPAVRSPEQWALMGRLSHFGSLLIVAPPPKISSLYEALHPTLGHDLRVSVALLADHCGVVVGVAGSSSERLLTTLRTIASAARREIKGVGMPPEFAWR